jgi:methionyl-tRNA synthetase
MSRFYLTTAIDYVNSKPHLGTAYEKVTADVIARYKRMAGFDVRFCMGNDEHSQNVYRRARELGEDPLAYCDRMEQVFRDVWGKLHVSFDDFIRTTEPRHKATVQAMAQRCLDAGDVYEGVYEGWYCVSCEAFKPEKDLVDGLCPIHLTKPDWIREKNYFFRLSKYRDRLLAHFEANPKFLQPDIRRNEILRLLEAGLEDISISRAGQSWGIPLPFDPGSVVYVWFDALINYAAAVGYATDPDLFAKWWPADLHIIGKDITRFHTVVWPAMLMSAGVALPKQVFGHGWVHFKGQKMSKSLGTVVDPIEAADRLGPDPLRLYLVKEVPFGGDGDFSWERFEERYNVDLANNLGNLVNRITTMVDRYRGGKLDVSPLGPGKLARTAAETLKGYREAMDRYALHEAAAVSFRLVDATNEFIAESEPWALAKDPANHDRLTQVLYDSAEALRVAAVLLAPIIPGSSVEILRRAGETTPAAELRLDRDAAWKGDFARQTEKGAALWPRLEAKEKELEVKETVNVSNPSEPNSVPAPAPVAAPAATGSGAAATPDDPALTPPSGDPVGAAASGHPAAVGTAAATGAAASAAAVATMPNPLTGERISIDDFMKVDLRVAKVLTAERVPKSKKLLKLTVDVGFEQRTLVAGIAEAYEPDTIIGRTIVIVANLKPATLMGIESNGMVLAGSPEGGKPQLVGFDIPLPPGSRVR